MRSSGGFVCMAEKALIGSEERQEAAFLSSCSKSDH
jgi:hypothetical protein